MSNNVLYDAPGPRTRRNTLIASLLAGVLIIVGLYFFVFRPLQDHGQLSMQLWGPIIDPGNEYFSPLWDRMRDGWTATFKAAILALLASFIVGTGLAMLRAQLRANKGRRYDDRPRLLSAASYYGSMGASGISRVWVEFFRGLPVVVTLFLVGKIADNYLQWDPLWTVIVGLTLYNGVVIGEILRSGMAGLPTGQREAASAVGLSAGQSIRLVQLPQAFRIMLPALISQAVVIFKDTSLGGLIVGYEEALRVGRGIVEVLNNSLPMYLTVGIMYMAVCYALSKLAEYFQRRTRRSGLVAVAPAAAVSALELSIEASGEPIKEADIPAQARAPR
ncbi:glutamate ABC transporter permease [Rhizocola hellebori]|uniref:Glutamate ABC transporter permease n=1 Tax=Rhizocola hellebori TaxID=1392758 RepID=A0A8J3VM82_9ACTN|nr:amino acid ABC transporter permease [Rhizocola hellebori]GIH10948.1 glutamate ABC transporter permease [Rhizocola hellebori]